MTEKIYDYVGAYTRVSKMLPEDLLDKVFQSSGVLDEGRSPRKGEPHFKFHWHAPMDVFFSYSFEGEVDNRGEPIEFVSPEAKVTMWPQSNQDLRDQIPNLEPAIVLQIEGRYSHWDDWSYTAWVRDQYLQTEQGKLLADKLMLAKLRLDPLAEDDEAA